MTSPAHPSDAATLPELIRLQMRRSYPLDTVAEVATKINIQRHSLISWVAGRRNPGAATLRDLLTKLKADEGTILSALVLLSKTTPGGQ